MSEAEQPATASMIAVRRAEADRWLEIARDDIDVALAATRLPRPRAGIAAYHLQQAAEKVFKALLILAGRRFRRTHDLDDLADELDASDPAVQARVDALRHITVWGIAYRYPGAEDEPEPEPTLSEIEDAAKCIGDLMIIAHDGA